MVSDVLAAPDFLAVPVLDHCRVVGAPRLLNVSRLQVGSHVTHSAPRERTDRGRPSASVPNARFASRPGVGRKHSDHVAGIARTRHHLSVARLLRVRGRPRLQMRELIGGPSPVLAPGCYDALSARLVEEAGFQATYMTGFGSSAGYLGRPDVGLMTMAEMVGNARRI